MHGIVAFVCGAAMLRGGVRILSYKQLQLLLRLPATSPAQGPGVVLAKSLASLRADSHAPTVVGGAGLLVGGESVGGGDESAVGHVSGVVEDSPSVLVQLWAMATSMTP